jgi:lipoprotein-releasing system permease protein
MSPLPYELALALRYLRPKRTFVSIITLICIVGVMLGVSVLVIVISVMTGFDIQFRERLVGATAHIQVESVLGPMTNWNQVVAKISKNPAVTGVAPYINTQVLMEVESESGGTRALGALVRGIDPVLENRINRITNTVVRGEFRLTPKSLLFGREIARRYRVAPGDHVAVYSVAAFHQGWAELKKARAAGKTEPEELPLGEDYKVRGLLDLGLHDFNEKMILCSLTDAQDLAEFGEAVQGLSVMLKDASLSETEQVQRELQNTLGQTFYVSSWLTENRDFLDALSTERAMMFYILFFIVIVAAFGIMSALITFVVQKTREIGMLKALGATPLSVSLLFLSQSLVVGILGVASGLGVGAVALAYRNEFLNFMSHKLGYDLFPSSVYTLSNLPAKIVVSDVVIITSVSLFFCLLAGLIPALRAAWLRPVEALRNE